MAFPRAVREFIKDPGRAPYALEDMEGVLKLKKRAADLRQKAAEADRAAMEAEVVFKVMCPHSDMVVGSKYISGDYYSKSETRYEVKCSMCGELLFEHTEYGGSHG